MRLFDLFYEKDKDKIKIGASSLFSLICLFAGFNYKILQRQSLPLSS